MPTEAPPAPAAAAPAIAKAPALPNAPKVEISVAGIAPTEPLPPPKKGSAREELTKSLAKFSEKKSAAASEPEPKPAAAKAPEPPKAPETPPEVEEPPAGEKPAAAEDPTKKAKVNPWKLVEEYKQKLAAAEASKLEVEKRAIPEDKWKAKEEEISKATSRLTELENEIRYVNYAKSQEFKEKYEVPYQQAFSRALSELGELQVDAGDGNIRSLEPADILELVNLPLGKAHALAVERFGDLAPEVMAHRKEIRGLWDKQAQALEDARKEGAVREERMGKERQASMEKMSSEIREVWARTNDEITADPKVGKFFTPVEGDAEINQRLAKGFELADRAFSENPANPNLTSEQRQSIIKRHAAVRNRAAAFGRLVYENGKAEATIAELRAEIQKLKSGEPDMTGSQPPVTQPARKNSMNTVIEELRKRAKQP